MIRTLILAFLLLDQLHQPVFHCKRQVTGTKHVWMAGTTECAVMFPLGAEWYAKIDRLPSGPVVTAQQRTEGVLETNEARFVDQATAESSVEKFCKSDDKNWTAVKGQ